MLDYESESRKQVGFFKKNPMEGPHIVLNLQVCTANLMTSFATAVKLLQKIYHNFSSVLHAITGFFANCKRGINLHEMSNSVSLGK